MKTQRQRAGRPLSRAAGVTINGTGFSLPSDENVLKLAVPMVVQLCDYTKNAELQTLNGWVTWHANYIDKAVTQKNEFFF